MKINSNLIRTSLSLLASLAVFGCFDNQPIAGSGSEAGNVNGPGIAGDVLVELPSSISSTGDVLAKKIGDRSERDIQPDADSIFTRLDADLVRDVYEYIREWTGNAARVIHGDCPSIECILDFADSLDWKKIAQTDSAYEEGDSLIVSARYDESSNYPYLLYVNAKTIEGSPRIIKAQLAGNRENPSGIIEYFIPEMESWYGDSLRILAKFEKTGSTKSLDLKMTQVLTDSTAGDPTSLQYAMRETNGIIELSVSTCHPNITGLIAGQQGHCYTFTGLADKIKNQAIVNLALPPSQFDGNSKELFEKYDIATLFGELFVSEKVHGLDSTAKSYMVTSYTEGLSVDVVDSLVNSGELELLPPDSIAGITMVDFRKFLELNSSVEDKDLQADLAEILWILDLSQPVYFDKNGYVSNGETAPEEFSELDAVEWSLSPFSPYESSNLLLDF